MVLSLQPSSTGIWRSWVGNKLNHWHRWKQWRNQGTIITWEDEMIQRNTGHKTRLQKKGWAGSMGCWHIIKRSRGTEQPNDITDQFHSIPIVRLFESVPWLYSTLWFRVCCVYGLKYNLAIRWTNKNATLILKVSAESQHFNRNPPYLCGSHRLPSCHGQATHSPIGREEQKMLKGCSPVDAGPHQKNGSYI